MTGRDLLEPSGPQRSLRHHNRPSTQYQVAPNAVPQRVRRAADGSLVGEVPVVPVAAEAARRERRRTIHIAFDADEEEPAPAVGGHRAVRDCEGYDLRPNPLETSTPAEFVAALRRYRRWAGNPSYRTLAERAPVSAAAFHAMLKGDELPKFTMLNAFIVACGGDEEEFQRWATAWRKLDQDLEGASSMSSVTLIALPEEGGA
jgi:predicted acylesterase/phospholipase RssA